MVSVEVGPPARRRRLHPGGRPGAEDRRPAVVRPNLRRPHHARAIQREEWDDDSGGSLRIETPGKPADIAGTITLLEDGSGTREVVELEVKVEAAADRRQERSSLAEKVAAGMNAEHGAGVAWLAGDR